MAVALAACAPAVSIAPVTLPPAVVRTSAPQDSAPKEEPRLVPSEAYLRTVLSLFGGVSPLEAQRRARGGDAAQLFDGWADYLSALGFPDYRNDLPRASETNAIMIAAFERLAVALCDRAVERDLHGKPPLPIDKRTIFAFDAPTAPPLDEVAFAPRFDVLHRTFLGYPAALAPSGRASAFFHLYKSTVARHSPAEAPPGTAAARGSGVPRSRFTPEEAGWAAVCQGLARHPEFHLY